MPLSRNLGTLTSWNPLGHSGPVTGLLYLCLLDILGFAISSVTNWMLSKERGETDVRVYQEDILEGVVERFNMTFFSGQEWVFQQGSVLAQKVRTAQE